MPIVSISILICKANTPIYTLSLHDALPILPVNRSARRQCHWLYAVPHHVLADPAAHVLTDAGREAVVEAGPNARLANRSEEHTSELQSRQYLVCRLQLEKKKATQLTPLKHR